MKKLMILSLAMALLASPAWGYKQEDLDKLAATNACEECDLERTDLRADLAGADLSHASLREANLGVAWVELIWMKLTWREATLLVQSYMTLK